PATLGKLLNTALESAKAPEWAEVLLFIDQFEELFTLSQKDTIEPFIQMLSELAEHPSMRVLVTIRHDFVHRAIENPILAELLNKGTFYLSAPNPGALLQMIERPAEMATLEFERGLPSLILRDTGSEAGSLALLAYLLDELYKIAMTRGDNRLTYADYEALGKVEGAIGKRAEQVFEKLPGEEAGKTRLLGQVFRELVTVEEVKGQFAATRQRVRHDCFGAEELALVEAFTQARLLVKDETQVEVAHETLFRSWGRLQKWIEEYQDDLILRRQVQNGAADWVWQGKPEAWRWSQERLLMVYAMQERLKWKPNPLEEDFIEPEQERLLRETNLLRTSHLRRDEIGRRLSVIG
ncbi:MAG: hypothetical protein HXX14_20645, partial [Bacteroidetes bacterium]|nr:hypothetical protein [Bacteroidota bacterium]